MLRLSAKSRYATRIMICLAKSSSTKPVNVQEIARSEEISSDYIEQILSKLRTHGLVASIRGLKGGFVLGRDASDISVADILHATEGKTALAPCMQRSCSRDSECVAGEVWKAAGDALEDIFSSTKLKALAQKAKHLSESNTVTFDI